MPDCKVRVLGLEGPHSHTVGFGVPTMSVEDIELGEAVGDKGLDDALDRPHIGFETVGEAARELEVMPRSAQPQGRSEKDLIPQFLLDALCYRALQDR